MLANMNKESNNSLDELLKALAAHLKHLHVWKEYFKLEGKHYDGDVITKEKEKEIHDLDMFGQLGSIIQSLEHEDLKFDVLKKEREAKETKDKEIKEAKEAKEKEAKEKEAKEKEAKEKESKEQSKPSEKKKTKKT